MPVPDPYPTVFANVIRNYRKRWWRWLLSPSWREMAIIDAKAQAESAYRMQALLLEQLRWKNR